MENGTEVTDFILVGLTNVPELQIPLFIVFTLIFLISTFGNLGMITLILLDSRLHTPMYFFIINLSLVDFGYSSAVTPKVMAGFLRGDKIISYNACAAQMFLFAAFASVENFLLASMAYDRYAAAFSLPHARGNIHVNQWDKQGYEQKHIRVLYVDMWSHTHDSGINVSNT
eukprot:bmy_22539T0